MNYIDAEKIYEETSRGLRIFQYYFSGIDFNGKQYVKCRKDERTASAQVSFFKGKWRITDFGNQSEMNGMNAISFVMLTEGLMYRDALRFIQDVIIRHEVGKTEFYRPVYKAKYSWREVGPEDKNGTYTFTFQPISENEVMSIGRYVTVDLLKKYNFKSVERYEMVSFSKTQGKLIVHIFNSTPDYPILLIEEGSFKKIYKPREPDKKYRFQYVGEKPNNYVFGLKQILESPNEFNNAETGEYEYAGSSWKKPRVKDLIRCSGESDAMNLASIGFNVYWLNSESATMDREIWKQLDGLCENHYQLLDIDETGKEMAMKFANQHIYLNNIQLPEWLKQKKDWRGNSCKDIKDFVEIAGNDREETLDCFLNLKRKAFAMKFWVKRVETAKGREQVSYSINLENYYYFLQSQGFYVVDKPYHRKSGHCYAHVVGKVVELINPEHIKKVIKRYTKDWIRQHQLPDEIAVLNKINSSNQISESNLQELKVIELDFCNHDNQTEYLHFRNGSLRITRDRIELIKHREVPHYILGRLEMGSDVISQIIDKDITLLTQPAIEINPQPSYAVLLENLKCAKTLEERENVNLELARYREADRYEVKINDGKFIFAEYLQDLAHIHWRKELEHKEPLGEIALKEQSLLLANLIFVLGYMSSQYKDPSKPWLVFMQDLKISQIGQSSGRSGKSLFCKSLSFVRPRFYIEGRKKDITEKTEFIYDGFTPFHNIIEVDDLHEFADFNFFYAQVTGNREVNGKYIPKQILPYEKSGKMVVSTNFELQNIDSSTVARILNCAVSDYYHEASKSNGYKKTWTPQLKYGRLLFDDFTDEEWNEFYNLIAYCIQLQMRFDRIQPPMDNLEKRQLRRQMVKGLSGDGEEFLNWANQYFQTSSDPRPTISPDYVGYFNTEFKREAAFENFRMTLSPSQSNKFTSAQFKKSLSAWCEYCGYQLNPEEVCNHENRIIRRIEGKAIEVFYIKKSTVD